MADEWTEVPVAADDWTEVTPTAQTSSPSTTRVKQIPFTPAQQKQYHALLKSPDTTPEALTAWGEEQGFGPATNSKEVVEYYRKYKDVPLPTSWNQIEPGVGINATPTADEWTEVPADAPAPKPDLGEPGLMEGLAYKMADYLNEKGGDSSGWTLNDENRRLLGADGPIPVARPLTDLPSMVGSGVVGAMRGVGMGMDMATDIPDAILGALGVEENKSNPLTRPGAAIDELLTNPMLGMETGVPNMGRNPVHDLPAIADNIGKQAAFEDAVAAATAAPYKSPRGKNQLKVHTKVLQDEADKISSSWKGGPEYKVVDNVEDIPDQKIKDAIANSAKPKDVEAVITPDGKVHIIAKNIKDPSRIAAIVYHEGLGHHGMSKMFGDKLDATLRAFYDTNPDFAAKTDAWRKRNKGQYGGDTARAADEVLAGISEGGILPPPALMDKLKNTIKNAARKAGMKNVNYSDREIMSILAEAHNRVVNGTPTIADGVTRFITAWHGTPAEKFNNTSEEHPHGKFDDKYMNSGEGAQAFGWGHYVAEDRNIAKGRYQDGLISRKGKESFVMDSPDGVPTNLSVSGLESAIQRLARDVVRDDPNLSAPLADFAGRMILDYFRDNKKFPNYKEMVKSITDWYGDGHVVRVMPEESFNKVIAEIKKRNVDFGPESKGSLFQVYLPDDKHWFSWDGPIEGPAKDAFEKLGVDSKRPFGSQGQLDAAKEELRAIANSEERVAKALADKEMQSMGGKFWEKQKEFWERHKERNATDRANTEKRIATLEKFKAEAGKESLTGMQMYYSLADKLKKEAGDTGRDGGQKLASKALAKEGIPGHKFLDGGSRSKGEGSHNYVIYDPDTSGVKLEARFSTRDKKSLTPEKMETKNDVDELVDFAATKAPKGARVSQKETTKRAEELGLTINAYLNAADQEVAAQIHGAHQVLTTAMDEVAGLGERAQTEGLTPTLRSEIGQKLATAMAVYAKFDKNTAEIGRALNILKVAARSKDFAKDIAKFSSDGGLAALLNDDEALMRFLKTQQAIKATSGSAAAAKFFKLQSKALPEDYAKTIIFNSMLSSPITWGKNAVGSPLNFTMDLIADTAGAVIGKIPGMAPGASGRELAARLYGPLAAFKNWETYKNVGKALKEGKNTRSKPFYEHRNDIFTGKASQFLKTPSHILAGVDELWANMFHASNVRGLAVSEAIKTGKKGDDLKAEIERLTNNPTDAMLKEADKVTNRQVFRGDPSKMVEWIKDHSTPVVLDQTEIRLVQDPTTGKMVPMGKTVRKADGALGRTGKFAMSLAVPFAPTLEQIGKAIVKNSGPLGLFSKELRADLMTPGPKRNSALGRIAVSSAFMYWIGTKAADGEVSGIGNPDYQQQKEEQATKPPMSIKIGDEWVSYAGLDPIAGMVAAVSTAVERSQAKDEPLPHEIGWAFISGMAESLLKSTYADSVANLINMAGEGVKVARGQETPKTGIENFVGGQVANITNPAFVRWYSQKFLDPKQRDISGDGTLMSGVAGRAMAGVPGVSETLPVKHDVYGREITNARQDKYVEKDPAIKELARLGNLMPDKALVSEVKRSDLEKLPKPILSKDLQRYQKKSGEYIVETVRQMQQSGEWDKMTDAEKLKEVLAIKKDMRANAREELFPDYYGENAYEPE